MNHIEKYIETKTIVGNYGELAMITLPQPVTARFVILGIVSFDKNPCLKFELMGYEYEEPSLRHLGFKSH